MHVSHPDKIINKSSYMSQPINVACTVCVFKLEVHEVELSEESEEKERKEAAQRRVAQSRVVLRVRKDIWWRMGTWWLCKAELAN